MKLRRVRITENSEQDAAEFVILPGLREQARRGGVRRLTALESDRRKIEEIYLKAVDIGYSYRLAKKMEEFKSNPVLGYRTAKPDEQFGALLDAQLRAKASQTAFQEISLDTVLSGTMGLGEEEKIPLILLVRWNTPCIKKLGLALDLLAQREIAVVGVILTDADARFLHAYYRM